MQALYQTELWPQKWSKFLPGAPGQSGQGIVLLPRRTLMYLGLFLDHSRANLRNRNGGHVRTRTANSSVRRMCVTKLHHRPMKMISLHGSSPRRLLLSGFTAEGSCQAKPVLAIRPCLNPHTLPVTCLPREKVASQISPTSVALVRWFPLASHSMFCFGLNYGIYEND